MCVLPLFDRRLRPRNARRDDCPVRCKDELKDPGDLHHTYLVTRYKSGGRLPVKGQPESDVHLLTSTTIRLRSSLVGLFGFSTPGFRF